MKRISKYFAALSIALIVTCFFNYNAQAQGEPPPPSTGGIGGPSGGVVGGGAPIGSGLVILLALGAGYGGKKMYDFRKKNNTLEEL